MKRCKEKVLEAMQDSISSEPLSPYSVITPVLTTTTTKMQWVLFTMADEANPRSIAVVHAVFGMPLLVQRLPLVVRVHTSVHRLFRRLVVIYPSNTSNGDRWVPIELLIGVHSPRDQKKKTKRYLLLVSSSQSLDPIAKLEISRCSLAPMWSEAKQGKTESFPDDKKVYILSRMFGTYFKILFLWHDR
jgi:hypothetical protein